MATNGGWKLLEEIAPGELVVTFDHGLPPVAGVHRIVLPRDRVLAHKAFTMFVPTGTLGNRRPLHRLPCPEVMVESDLAGADVGQPFGMIQSLRPDRHKGTSRAGIGRAPLGGDLSIRGLTFAVEQVLDVGGAVLATARAASDFSPLGAARAGGSRTYPRLTLAQRRGIAQDLRAGLPQPAQV